MQAQKLVTKIDANPLLVKHNNENSILRVCAYCRVSTDSDDQVESYRAQVEYYTQAIAKNPKWRFVDIYADEGITGTSVRKRDRFNKMMKDCEKGKIDLILTKSVSRFARNTVDSLKYVRKLKAKGVGVFFEEQNLDSLKADSEMFIGIHSVLAQAESENISANVRWGIQQRMRTGTYAFRYNLLGYKKGEDGQPEIVDNEAETIRKIYQMYLDGNSLDQIKSYLESHNILTFKGKSEWSKSIIQSILTNEKYAGDMMLQKTYIENCITKKSRVNRGEKAKYYITNNHKAIIDKSIFNKVQIELARRSSKRKIAEKTITEQGKYSGKYALSDLLICGVCGSAYRRRTWTKNGTTRRVWRCLSRIENGTKYCQHSPSIDEEKLQKAIFETLSNGLDNNVVMDMIISNLSYIETGDDDTLDIFAIENQINVINQQMNQAFELMENTEGDKTRYEDTIQKCCHQSAELRKQLDLAKQKIASKDSVQIEIEEIRNLLQNKTENFKEYNDTFVRKLIEHIRIMPDKSIAITLKCGIKIDGKAD